MNNSVSTTSPAWPTRWPDRSFGWSTLWLVLAALGAAIVAGAIGVAALAAYIFANHIPFTQSDLGPALIPLLLVQLLVEGAVVAVILVGLPRVSKFSLRELGFRAMHAKDVLYSLLGMVGMVVFADGGSALVQYLTHAKHEQDAIRVLKALHGGPQLAFFAVFAIVLAPVIEETIFRVFFFNVGLRYGGFWVAAIASGLLFGLAHGDLYAAFPLALGGMVLAGVYYRTRNAYASMISHGLFNSITTLILIFAPQLADK